MKRDDFNMSMGTPNGIFVRLEEINKMIACGVLSVDKDKLLDYKFDTTVMYSGNREDAFELWRKYL